MRIILQKPGRTLLWLVAAIWFLGISGCGATAASPSAAPAATASNSPAETAAKPRQPRPSESKVDPNPPQEQFPVVQFAPAGVRPTGPDLADHVPAKTAIFFAIPNLKETYTKYQATGIGRWIQSAEMKPFRDSMRQSGALSLANIAGILGFEENLLTSFTTPACILAVPGKHGAANIFLIQTPKDDPAIATCLAAAEKYHTANKGKKTPTKIDGADFATLYVTPRTAPDPAEEHLYFYTHGFFGIGGEAAAVQTLIKNWPTAPANALSADPAYQSTQAAVARTNDLTWFVRPLEALELLEGPEPTPVQPVKGQPVPKKKKNRPTSLILKQEGFTKMMGMSGSMLLNSKDMDVDYLTAIQAELPYVRGMRILEWKPGPKLELPSWVPAGVAELMWTNTDPRTQADAYGNWFDQLAADGDIGTYADIIKGLEEDPKGPKVKLKEDLWGTLEQSTLQVVDVKGKPHKFNLEGRLSLTVTESRDPKAVRDTLRKYFAADKDVKREDLPGGEMWFVPPGKALFIDAGSKMPQINTAAVVGKQVIMSNDTAWLRTLLTAKAPTPAANDPRLAPLIARVVAGETKATSVRQVALFDDSWASGYEGLKSGDKTLAESSSVRLLKIILTGDTSDKYLKEYKLLPPFAVSKQYLSPGGGSSDSFPHGIFSRGFILKPGSAAGPMKN